MHSMKLNSRVQSLKAMNDVIEHLNNDEAYQVWLSIGFPDEPTPQQLLDIAEDTNLYNDILNHFMYVLRNYYLDGYME